MFCQSRGRRRAKDVGGVSCQCVVLTAAARAGDKHGHASKQTGTNKAGSGQGLASSRRVRQQSHAAVWGVVLAPSCVARDKEIDDWFAGITPGAAGGGSTALSVSQLCHRRVSQRYRIKRLFPIMCALAMCLCSGGGRCIQAVVRQLGAKCVSRHGVSPRFGYEHGCSSRAAFARAAFAAAAAWARTAAGDAPRRTRWVSSSWSWCRSELSRGLVTATPPPLPRRHEHAFLRSAGQISRASPAPAADEGAAGRCTDAA